MATWFDGPAGARRRAARKGVALGWAALYALAAFVAATLAAGVPPEGRAEVLRLWVLAALGVQAVAVPHVLHPDPRRPWVLLLNPPPSALLRRQLGRALPLLGLMLVPGPVLALVGSGAAARLGLMTAGLAVVLGQGLCAILVNAGLGARAKAWQDGRRGGWYRWLAANTPLQPVGLPLGMMPIFLATPLLFTLGVAALLVGLTAPGWAGWPGVGLVAAAVAGGLRLRRRYDAVYYQTDALVDEMYRRAGGAHLGDRPPVAYEAVYWAPSRWRPHVWALLRQLDRRLPLGRYVALGLAAVVLTAWSGASAAVLAPLLLLLSLARNAAVAVTARAPMAPLPLQWTVLSAPGWVVVRTLVNLRWTPAWAAVLLVIAAFDGDLGLAWAAAWTGLDLLLSLGAAALATAGHEVVQRKRYA